MLRATLEQRPNWQTYGLIFALTYGALLVGGWITSLSLMEWYPLLHKPVFTPPNWAFPVAWNTLYLLMAAATCRLWQTRHGKSLKNPLILFALQLALNILWSALHFGLRHIDWALIEIVLMWGLAWPMVMAYFRTDRWAGVLMLPYLGWLTFACVLNFMLWRLNLGSVSP